MYRHICAAAAMLSLSLGMGITSAQAAAVSGSEARSTAGRDATGGSAGAGVAGNRLAGPPYLWSQSSTKNHTDVGISVPYIPLVACRLVDTRGVFSPVYGGPIYAANEVRSYQVAGNCGIPADAAIRSLAMQVIVPPPPGAGDIEILPYLGTFGSTVAMVFEAAKWNSVSVISKANAFGAGGEISVQVRSVSAHVVIDVVGYYADNAGTGTEMYLTGVPSASRGLLNVDLNGAVSGTSAVSATSASAGVDLGTAGGNAIDVIAGGLRVQGAGLNTNTIAYIHTVAVPADNCPNPDFVQLNNPGINLNPGAILMVTGTGGGTGATVSAGPSTNPVTLYYSSGCNPAGGWNLFRAGGFANGAKYNILVIKP